MASSVKPQAITGVSADSENIVTIVYPSIGCTGTGRFVGQVCDSISWTLNGIKLSYLLFALPLLPVALLWYLALKVVGERYVLTNRAIQRWKALGSQLVAEVSLAEIDEIAVDELPGQAFYKAADLLLLNAAGETILRLPGVQRAEIFRHNILEARDAQAQVRASLETIEARQSA